MRTSPSGAPDSPIGEVDDASRGQLVGALLHHGEAEPVPLSFVGGGREGALDHLSAKPAAVVGDDEADGVAPCRRRVGGFGQIRTAAVARFDGVESV